MAGVITETEYNVSPNLGGKVIKFKGVKTAQHDHIIFGDPIGVVVVNQADGTVDTVAYASFASTDDAPGVLTDDASDDTFTYDSATADELPATLGYIMMDNEIMQYTAGGAATDGTITGLHRGMYGTTVAAHVQNKDVYILNTITLGDTVTGLVRGIADVIEE
jgi:hypothetical protein